MTEALITARKPLQVAHEVAALAARGCVSFVVVAIDHGGMLDLERLGAARYAAGLQSCVVLVEEEMAAASAAIR